MQKFLIGGKRVLESSGPSPAEPPRKVLVQQANHPPEDTKYVCRQQSSGKDKLDTPFKVARWGADIISSAGDIIPDGFRVERTLQFVRSSSLFAFSEVYNILRLAISTPSHGISTLTEPPRTSRTSTQCTPCSSSRLRLVPPPFCGRHVHRAMARDPGTALGP